MATNSNSNSNSKAKVATVSHLLHRVAASCLSQRFPATRTFDEQDDDLWSCNSSTEADKDKDKERKTSEDSIAKAIAREKLEDEEEEEQRLLRMWEEDKDAQPPRDHHPNVLKHRPSPSVDADFNLHFKEQVNHMDALLAQVFHSVSAVKHAYRAIQHSHCPWDPHRMQAADAAVVSELHKLDTLRDRFRRGRRRPPTVHSAEPTPPLTIREAVAPYEAAIDDLKKELKVKEAEAENLRQKLRNSEMLGASRRGRSHSSRWSKGVGAGTVGKVFWFSN